MTRASIIIPTFGNRLSYFIRCLNSIVRFTDLSKDEVVVVANGCESNELLREYMESFKTSSIRVLWFDEPLGATGAINEGIKSSLGDYVILFNDDAMLLESYNSKLWIDILLEPFKDPEMGITGPDVTLNRLANRDMITFFCACISRKVFDKIGLLDMIFNPGGHEDIDFSIRALNAGFKIARVPLSAPKDGRHYFPIYHSAGHSEWMTSEIHDRNEKIIFDRYYKTSEIGVIKNDRDHVAGSPKKVRTDDGSAIT